ncbi:hypothetical protein ACFOHY_22680 [Rhizobium rosettiformans]|uniref:hypothetical protein n=1 Tax=Rhizobium rosettiformans TaxID=1368430 RepID=UPI00361BE06E
MTFHHHEARGRLPGSDGTMKHNLHFADLLTLAAASNAEAKHGSSSVSEPAGTR